MASPKEKLALERAHAFLAAKLQERDITDGTVPPNFNKFVEETTAAATAHFLSVPPEVKAKIIEDANSEAMMAWLRGHKDLMRRLKTDASDPRRLPEIAETTKLTPEQSRAAAQLRFAKSLAEERAAWRNYKKGIINDADDHAKRVAGPALSNRVRRQLNAGGRAYLANDDARDEHARAMDGDCPANAHK